MNVITTIFSAAGDFTWSFLALLLVPDVHIFYFPQPTATAIFIIDHIKAGNLLFILFSND